jgi:MazG family protein
MHVLRAPGGCPWDAEQTAESLTPFILEEACEAIEAIESGSVAMIADELGDLLLQIVFQAEIFSERQLFDFADVAEGIKDKLIRRHPHVFGGLAAVASSDELEQQWEKIKGEERSAEATPSLHPLEQVPVHLPALQRAQKLLVRAQRAGFDLERDLPLPVAATIGTEDDLGRALLALVKEADLLGLDAEQTLRRTLHKLFGTLSSRHVDMTESP